MRVIRLIVAAWFAGMLIHAQDACAADRPQWGERYSRNMISDETGLPVEFDTASGRNVKWSASLGGNAYGTPTIANGKVLIGANNESPRDPRNQGDRGVLLCLNESDGSLVWQLAAPRIGGDNYLDWPMIAMCSAPTIEGDRVYTLTNRFEVVCLDLEGQSNGNDGPYQDEGRHMSPADEPPLEVTAIDADIVWLVDMPSQIGMYPHDSAHTSILIDGSYLYLNTCNGVDNTHKVVRKPDAPSLIVLDKQTGKLLAKDEEHIGPRIFHSTWSPPALGEVNGQRQIIFGGADGVCYGFEALAPSSPPDAAQILKRLWRFDCDPTAPKENVATYLNNRKESPSIIESMPVFYNKHVYVTVGGDIWWGKEKAWVKCIDATQTGEITGSAETWSYPIETHCCSTPAIANGLVFVGDCKGVLHCLDAETGQAYWTHDVGGEIWGSALAADGNVYIGSRSKDFCVLSAAKEKNLLFATKFPAPIAATPVAANGVLYVNTLDCLYALKKSE